MKCEWRKSDVGVCVHGKLCGGGRYVRGYIAARTFSRTHFARIADASNSETAETCELRK